jgi:predicted enzyme related to lactoylglutathione lyase
MLENTKAYSGFAVDDMDKARAFYAETLSLGIVRVPDFPAGAWFTDPAGNIIAVHEPMSA